MIEADGFRVDAEVEMLLSSDSAVGAAKSAALALMGVAECLDRLGPDLLVVLGTATRFSPPPRLRCSPPFRWPTSVAAR